MLFRSGDWLPDEPPDCEKHSVANNSGSGEDLSEALIYSRLQWRASHEQERPCWFQTPVYVLFDDGTLPCFPTEWVIQVHDLSDASQTMHGLPLPACSISDLTFLLVEAVMFLHLPDLTEHRDFHRIVLRSLVVCIFRGRLLSFLITASIPQYPIPYL